MRTLALTTALILAAAPAFAQPGVTDQTTVGAKPAATAQPPEIVPDGHSSSASQTLNPTMANGAPPVPAQAQTGEAKPASANVTSPANWTGTPDAWNAHTAACARRYKGYDAATDRYPGWRGRMVKCAVGVR
jgi:hypothetical protein